MMMNENDIKWKVTKEEKALYKFLNTISSVLKNDNGEGTLFIEDGILYFATWFIAGYVDINQNDKKVYGFAVDGFYGITRTMKQDFILNMIDIENLKENKREEIGMMKARAKNAVIKGRYMCSIGEEENCIIAKISNITGKFLKDSYIGLMKNLKDSNVYENEYFVMFEHEEYIEKENTNITTVISFFCDKTKENEYNQEKMEI